jgi:hypothetical protein
MKTQRLSLTFPPLPPFIFMVRPHLIPVSTPFHSRDTFAAQCVIRVSMFHSLPAYQTRFQANARKEHRGKQNRTGKKAEGRNGRGENESPDLIHSSSSAAKTVHSSSTPTVHSFIFQADHFFPASSEPCSQAINVAFSSLFNDDAGQQISQRRKYHIFKRS